MPLAAGTKLGPYEITAPIGAGGMGEVYRAKDMRLDRIVAIKVLPAHLSSNPDLRQRFEREARTISSLNHPNICTLHDIGHQNGIDYLVMEFIEGETLASRLRNGALPPIAALNYSIQIANALDKAHRQGIVHRDLKPGNIILTKSGMKLLDFGLAKYTAPATESVSMMETGQPLTREGTVLGTFQYMAPEQLEGAEADARTDIFAFGAVVYEMTTGKKAFEGKTQASLIAAILKEEPKPISHIQPMTPPLLERFVKTCLAKDPEDRWQTAHDAMLELQGILESLSRPEAYSSIAQPKQSKLGWMVGIVGAVLAIVFAALYFIRPSVEQQRVLRFEIVPPDEKAWYTGSGPLTVSPDGKHMAFLNNADGRRTLWVRSFDSTEARQLPGTEYTSAPFWSPDSRYLGFFSKGKLMKIDISGGRPQIICDAETNRGGSWGSSGIIIFAQRANGPLFQVPASGGEFKPATKLDGAKGEISHRFPTFMPDGRRFLYLVRGSTQSQAIYTGSLDSNEKKLLLNSTSRVHYAPPGYLLYGREGELLVQAIDSKTLELEGAPILVTKNVFHSPTGQSVISASNNGILAYWSGNISAFQLSWFDRSGNNIGTLSEGGGTSDARYHRLSADGTQLVWLRPDPDLASPDIWVTDTARNISTRLTSRHYDENPAWSPDGKTILFNRDLGDNQYEIYSISATGVGGEKILLKNGVQINDWSMDGKWLIGQRKGKRSDLWIVPMSGSGQPYPFLASEFYEFQASFSPDARWIAYASDESGHYEVYIQPFPASGKKWRISNSGGAQPRWRRDGKELFYFSGDRKVMAVDIKTDDGNLEAGVPKELFQPLILSPFYPLGMDYDVTADGLRFIISSAVQRTTPPVNIIFNWTALLRR
ncbi:protein kinase [bacterium]|nr:protein kinase [bacterium]